MGDGCVIRAHAFGGLGFHANLSGLDAEKAGHVSLDLPGMGPDLGRSQDERGVHVGDGVARASHLAQGFFKKDGGIGALPLGIGGRKESSDIAGGDRAQQRIGQRVEQDIAVGMAGQALIVRQKNAADLKGNAGAKLMGIPAKAYSHEKTLSLITQITLSLSGVSL